MVHGTTAVGNEHIRGHPPHMLGQGAHSIGLLDWYRGLTKYKKVRSCDTYTSEVHLQKYKIAL